ncbi:MAG: hypothetical protein IT327_32555 [Anaerolineae bacterium]|nr:hypothetical protein [Anaerolineae bacterium]
MTPPPLKVTYFYSYYVFTPYWDDQIEVPEFPIAIADLWKKKKLVVGVPLWDNGRFTPADLEELVQNMHLLPQAGSKKWEVGLVVFGRRPFTAEVHAAADAARVRLVTLAEIEPLLLMAREVRQRKQDSPASESFEF